MDMDIPEDPAGTAAPVVTVDGREDPAGTDPEAIALLWAAADLPWVADPPWVAECLPDRLWEAECGTVGRPAGMADAVVVCSPSLASSLLLSP